jgi:hypothetical protein
MDSYVASTAHHVVGLALQMCAAQARARAAEPAMSPWPLESLSIQWQILPGFFQPLSACTSLLELELTFSSANNLPPAPSAAALFAALGRLQTLRKLSLHDESDDAVLGSSFAARISCVTRLERLKLLNALDPSAAEALPASIQALTVLSGQVNADEADCTTQWPALDLRRLSSLQALHLHCNNEDFEREDYFHHMSAQLERGDEVIAAAGLQRVRTLYVSDGLASIAMVKRLSLLQDLRELDLGLDGNGSWSRGDQLLGWPCRPVWVASPQRHS